MAARMGKICRIHLTRYTRDILYGPANKFIYCMIVMAARTNAEYQLTPAHKFFSCRRNSITGPRCFKSRFAANKNATDNRYYGYQQRMLFFEFHDVWLFGVTCV